MYLLKYTYINIFNIKFKKDIIIRLTAWREQKEDLKRG